jgi:hypothetical protein
VRPLAYVEKWHYSGYDGRRMMEEGRRMMEDGRGKMEEGRLGEGRFNRPHILLLSRREK